MKYNKQRAVWRITVIVAALLFFGSYVSAQQPQQQPLIKAIEIRGNDSVDTSVIEDAITKTKIEEYFIDQNVLDDIEAIYSLGYFYDVVATWEFTVDHGIKIIFELEENPVITDIVIRGASVAPVNDFLSEMIVKKGDVLNVHLLLEDLERFPEWILEQHGIALRPVNLNVTDDGVVEIDVAESRIQDIRLEGNEKTLDHVIMRELSFESGDIFDINKVQNSLRNVLMLGFFDEIGFTVEDGDDDDLVILVIHLEERKTGNADFGVGFSSSSGLWGQIDISDENFLGRGQRANVFFKIGRGSRAYEIGFYEPYILPGGTSLGVNIYNTHDDISDKTIDVDEVTGTKHVLGGDISVGHPLGEYTRGNLKLTLDNTKYSGDLIDYPDYADPYTALTIGAAVNTNTTDHPFAPTEGFKNNVNLETSIGLFGSDVSYSRIYLEHSRYYNVYRDDIVFALRALGGRRLSGDLPPGQEYTVGGAETLRGYDYGDTRLTGDKMIVLNSELRFPIYDFISGVAFTDWGNAWEPDEQMNLTDLLNSYGVGVRIDTPLGLLRLDYGWGTNDEGKREGKFYFSVGHTY